MRDTDIAILCILHLKGLIKKFFITAEKLTSTNLVPVLDNRCIGDLICKHSCNLDLQEKNLIVMEREPYLVPTPPTSLLHCIDPIYTGLGLLNDNF